jgi:hypothetical protein
MEPKRRFSTHLSPSAGRTSPRANRPLTGWRAGGAGGRQAEKWNLNADLEALCLLTLLSDNSLLPLKQTVRHLREPPLSLDFDVVGIAHLDVDDPPATLISPPPRASEHRLDKAAD